MTFLSQYTTAVLPKGERSPFGQYDHFASSYDRHFGNYAQRFMPAPGTTTGFKRGGEVHDDEAEDRKLFKKMYKEEEAHEGRTEKRKDGGGVTGLPGDITRDEGRGMATGRGLANPYDVKKHLGKVPGELQRRKRGGSVDETEMFKKSQVKEGDEGIEPIKRARGGTVLAPPKYRDQGAGKRARGGGVGFTPTNQDSEDPGLAGTKYHQQGVGFRKMGGDVGESRGMGPPMPGSAAGGLGRLEKSKMAGRVPAKTES